MGPRTLHEDRSPDGSPDAARVDNRRYSLQMDAAADSRSKCEAFWETLGILPLLPISSSEVDSRESGERVVPEAHHSPVTDKNM